MSEGVQIFGKDMTMEVSTSQSSAYLLNLQPTSSIFSIPPQAAPSQIMMPPFLRALLEASHTFPP